MQTTGASSNIEVMGLQEFFHNSMQLALKHQHVAVADHTEHYLVNVLTQFARADAFYDQQSSSSAGMPPLVKLLAAAAQAPTREEQRRLLQRLGDVSIFVAGFFAHGFARRLVDVDYHIAMGGRAYGTLADTVRDRRERAIAGVFAELARKFQPLVDVLNDVAEMARPTQNQDVLRWYEIWIKTRSARAQHKLSAAGVIPLAKGGSA